MITEILGEVFEERTRQEQLVQAGKFDWTCADPNQPDVAKLPVLVEEVGEVARCLCDMAKDPEWREKLREELVQVAAVAVAWVEALS